MSMKTITFEAPEESIVTIDEIAAYIEADRETVLREALSMYLADYQQELADAAEADRELEAGETIAHEDILAKYNAWKASSTAREAA